MSFVDLALDGPVATITLRHPTGNRINFRMREELLAAVGRVADGPARVLVFKGDGDDFCLGGDIREWPGVPAAALRPRIEVYAEALDRLDRLSIPTVAAVQGGCMGGGFELALSCDLIVAARSARFAFPEARLGIMTLQGGLYQLAERVGRTRALELVMLSTPVDAARMQEWNVVNTVVDDDALDAAANDLALRLAAGPTAAYARTKALMRIWRDEGRLAARRALYDVSMPLFDTPDVQQSLRRAATAAGEASAARR